jgi:rhodanese-related sulfurtransferase
MSNASATTIRPLSPAEAKALCDRGELVIVDVRTEVEHAVVHAVGVDHMPLDKFNASDLKKKYDGKTIACICKAGTRGGKAAQSLIDAGCTRVANITGGTEAWIAAGLPVERGAGSIIPLERQVLIGAGTFVLTGVLLSHFVSPLWIILPAFVGCGLVVAGVTGFCGLGMVLARMPWNRNLGNKKCGGASCAA